MLPTPAVGWGDAKQGETEETTAYGQNRQTDRQSTRENGSLPAAAVLIGGRGVYCRSSQISSGDHVACRAWQCIGEAS